MNKQRYTLVPSLINEGGKAFAKVVHKSGCSGCSFNNTPQCLQAPACAASRRHDNLDVIFISEMAKW